MKENIFSRIQEDFRKKTGRAERNDGDDNIKSKTEESKAKT